MGKFREEGDAMKLLVINPGSTSTKISLYENRQVVFEENIFHDAPELLKFAHVNDQMAFRQGLILRLLEKYTIDRKSVV